MQRNAAGVACGAGQELELLVGRKLVLEHAQGVAAHLHALAAAEIEQAVAEAQV
jgi:hypothetical protein